jgi:hypothetical protein
MDEYGAENGLMVSCGSSAPPTRRPQVGSTSKTVDLYIASTLFVGPPLETPFGRLTLPPYIVRTLEAHKKGQRPDDTVESDSVPQIRPVV